MATTASQTTEVTVTFVVSDVRKFTHWLEDVVRTSEDVHGIAEVDDDYFLSDQDDDEDED